MTSPDLTDDFKQWRLECWAEPTRYAQALAKIDRAPRVALPDGTPESVAVHTLALALTVYEWMREDGLPGFAAGVGAAVMVFALAHDLHERHDGDTDTFLRDHGGKDLRSWERVYEQGMGRWRVAAEFYERQEVVAARYVRCVDKMLPKINRALAGRKLADVSEVAWCEAQIEREIGPLAEMEPEVAKRLRARWLALLDAIRPEVTP